MAEPQAARPPSAGVPQIDVTVTNPTGGVSEGPPTPRSPLPVSPTLAKPGAKLSQSPTQGSTEEGGLARLAPQKKILKRGRTKPAIETPAKPKTAMDKIYDVLGYVKEFLAASQVEPEVFQLEKESYIFIPMGEMMTRLSKSAKKALQSVPQRDTFDRVCRSISTYYNVKLQTSTQDLLHGYAFFDPLISDEVLSDLGWEDKKIDVKEMQVLLLLLGSFKKANYKLLEEDDYVLATSQNYKLQMEIALDRTKLDNTLFDRWFSNPANENVERANVTDFMLIFHRGVGVDQTTDIFMEEKLNIMLSRWWSALKKAVAKVRGATQRKPSAAPPSSATMSDQELATASVAPVPEESNPPQTDGTATPAPEHLMLKRAASTTLGTPPAPPGKGEAIKKFLQSPAGVCTILVLLLGIVHETINRLGVGWIGTWVTIGGEVLVTYIVMSEVMTRIPPAPIEEQRVQRWEERAQERALLAKKEIMGDKKVQRIRLENQPITVADLFTTTTIQEPTFKDVVIVYRPAGTRHIVMKHFHDIPMADLEVVYPFKVPALNMFDLVKLVCTILAGLVSLIVGQKSDAGMSSEVMYAIALGMLMLAANGYSGLQQQKAVYNSLLTQTLYDKQLSNNDTMILQLIHDVEEQEVNEACLAFYILTTCQDPKVGMEVDQIDEAAEEYLKQQFNLEVDFDVSDALDKLKDLGLVTNQGSKYVVVPLEQCVDIMTKEWARLQDLMAKQTGGKSNLKRATTKSNKFGFF
eukprot:comp24114_c1_seq1/m.43630 comp24114_c1_seq1/g.43630  ORF comp24114_c1_seq1/g.43630 comp24114_c1_seq1/m.43630 type:complete len:750 (-) comp24114_c1_seq1:52-2301(-)